MITRERVQNRDLAIGIIGLGYVGLPTAIGFHEVGFKVFGMDISEEVVKKLNNGIMRSIYLAVSKFTDVRYALRAAPPPPRERLFTVLASDIT